MDKHILVVMSNATEGGDDEFNDWYTKQHLGDVLGIPGFTAAQRFVYREKQNPRESPYRYLAIYEIEAETLAEAHAALDAAVTGDDAIYVSPALDGSRTDAWYFKPITERVTSQ